MPLTLWPLWHSIDSQSSVWFYRIGQKINRVYLLSYVCDRRSHIKHKLGCFENPWVRGPIFIDYEVWRRWSRLAIQSRNCNCRFWPSSHLSQYQIHSWQGISTELDDFNRMEFEPISFHARACARVRESKIQLNWNWIRSQFILVYALAIDHYVRWSRFIFVLEWNL